MRQVLEQEGGYLESKQLEMSTARQFLFVLRFTKGEKPEQVFQAINLTEKTISEQGFEVRRMDREDLKRVLGLYFGTSMTGEAVEDVDGIKNFNSFFMISLIIQQLYREILSVADENGGKLKNRCVFFCDEYGTRATRF